MIYTELAEVNKVKIRQGGRWFDKVADEQPLQAHLRDKPAKEPSAEERGVSPWLRFTPTSAGLDKRQCLIW